MSTRAERDAEIAFERNQLERADTDLAQGWNRYLNQLELVATLHDKRRDTTQAERLVGLLEQTLQQWEVHRKLILQRIAHLEELNKTSVLD